MSEAIFGVIGTIIGTILGFMLSEWATRQREERTEKRQTRAIHTMLRLEIDQNLALLRDFWSKVNQVDESEQDPNLACLHLARRMVGLPVPHWCHTMWKSQTPLLVVALSEEEIKQVHDLHNRLDAIAAIHSKLSALRSEQREESRATGTKMDIMQTWAAIGRSKEFSRNALGLWMECERIVRKVLDKGNPLQDQTHNGR
ncbi:MAG: hypothetical protein H8E47_09275 [Anaerolineales bacterium]|nr:hypothetical protein [Anaerolineales bacterium]